MPKVEAKFCTFSAAVKTRGGIDEMSELRFSCLTECPTCDMPKLILLCNFISRFNSLNFDVVC